MAVIDRSKLVTTYTEYAINAPMFPIKFIQEQFALRDAPGLFLSQDTKKPSVGSIRVTGQHPLVSMLGALIESNSVTSIPFADLLPAVAVVETGEAEENNRMGQNTMGWGEFTPEMLDGIKAYTDYNERAQEGLITDNQIALLENAIIAHNQKYGNSKLSTYTTCVWQRESFMVSLWAENLEVRQALGDLLRSILVDLRYVLSAKKVIDVQLSKTQGLINANFGRILYGEETSLSFINWHKTVYVLDSSKIDDVLDENGMLPLDCTFIFESNGSTDQGNKVLNPPGEPYVE